MWRIDRKKCLKCGGCVSVCPVGALELTEQGIVHDAAKCTLCGLCAKACPVSAITVTRNA